MIRKCVKEDLPAVMEIIKAAKVFMIRNGNPSQWGDAYPTEAVIAADIEKGQAYAVLRDEKIAGYFVLIIGEEPTYQIIEDGSWLNDDPYGTIHRLASDETAHGIFREVTDYCGSVIPQLRADTHEDNHIMKKLLERCGFVRCGIIHVEDGTPRTAYMTLPGRKNG